MSVNPFDPFSSAAGAVPSIAPPVGYNQGPPPANTNGYPSNMMAMMGATSPPQGQPPQQQQYPNAPPMYGNNGMDGGGVGGMQDAYGANGQYPGPPQPPQVVPPSPGPGQGPTTPSRVSIQDPWGSAAATTATAASNPAPQQQQQPQRMNPFASAQSLPKTPMMSSPAASTAPGGYNPFDAPQQQQMVLSQQPSNPYGGIVAGAPQQQQHMAAQNPFQQQQAMVPAPQQGFAWSMPQQQQPQQQQAYGSSVSGFDPFAAPPPPPAPAPAPMPDPASNMMMQPYQPYPQQPHQQQQQQQQAPPMPPSTQQPQDNPFGDFLPQAPPAPAPAPAPEPPQPVNDKPSPRESQIQPYRGGGGGGGGSTTSPPRNGGGGGGAIVPVPNRNPYALEIARRSAPAGASPLPKAELVKKKGYVLSRISFRTIVMKKWKQSFWVQYGSHTMLWFRNEEDFKDWLNNPYHTQAQRNFLIKLAVNFVHDLYKPSVRGYQVTQTRVKPYGNKMVRQFKLERWMDYGPTIAAAFGSYDSREVEELRKAIVECMRNTPLDNGIRATGAVRQSQQQQQQPPQRQPFSYDRTSPRDRRHSAAARTTSNPTTPTTTTSPDPRPSVTATRSVVSTTDLLDDHNRFDMENASVAPTPSHMSLVPAYAPQQQQPYPYAMGVPPAYPPQYQQPQQPQQQYQQQYQQQQPPPAAQYHQPPQYNEAPPTPSSHQQYQQPPQSYYAQAPQGQQQQQQQQQFGFQQQTSMYSNGSSSYPAQGGFQSY